MTADASRDRLIQNLLDLCIEMGHIIRLLDENTEWNWWWTLDGVDGGPEYVQDGKWMEAYRVLHKEEETVDDGE